MGYPTNPDGYLVISIDHARALVALRLRIFLIARMMLYWYGGFCDFADTPSLEDPTRRLYALLYAIREPRDCSLRNIYTQNRGGFSAAESCTARALLGEAPPCWKTLSGGYLNIDGNLAGTRPAVSRGIRPSLLPPGRCEPQGPYASVEDSERRRDAGAPCQAPLVRSTRSLLSSLFFCSFLTYAARLLFAPGQDPMRNSSSSER